MTNVSAGRSLVGEVVRLGDVRAGDGDRAGHKAANLGELAALGLLVPDGFVVVGEPAREHVAAALGSLGGPVAVRSSGVMEDLAGASFAGQYETVLGVGTIEELEAAIAFCRASATTARVAEYLEHRVGAEASPIAVLVQRMVDADAAGVAFTANPLTGKRDEVIVTAARGLGERVVSGEAVGDEWVVVDRTARCRRAREHAIDTEVALAVAGMARRCAAHFGVPQDVEWAIAGGTVYVLQSRPITALPDPVEWAPPGRGFWQRNFRLGEWLHEPVTPLFFDWVLPLMRRGHCAGARKALSTVFVPADGQVNGWYYSRTVPSLLGVVTGLLPMVAHPARARRFASSLRRLTTEPARADRDFFGPLTHEWRADLLPRYRRIVDESAPIAETASGLELIALVEQVAGIAGEYLWSIAVGGGSAWKIELGLASFLREHLPERPDIQAVTLLRGLPGTEPDHSAHAVQGLDWYWPTLGELGLDGPAAASRSRHRQLGVERAEAEYAVRQALAKRPELLRRFDETIEVAQRYVMLREEQTRQLTIGWPLLRRCVRRLGDLACANGSIDAPDDVFFLTRADLDAALSTKPQSRPPVEKRRAAWEAQRRLAAPLVLGSPPRGFGGQLGQFLSTTLPPDLGPVAGGSIVGQAASPGRASGPVRIVRGHEDFDSFRAGEVLVTRSTAPAWTPLFALAAAIVTDGGNVAAHASLVAREYGIPAVVATGDATLRLVDGEVVLVDGGAGYVQIVN